jgi:hypothetical protein
MCLHVGVCDLTGLAKRKARFIPPTTRNNMAGVGAGILATVHLLKGINFFFELKVWTVLCIV